jgi:nucleotide-binding universal stress UspA family protein
MDTTTEDMIVVGIDGSQYSDRALAWAITEAHRSGRQVLLVHAWTWRDDVVAPDVAPGGGSNAQKTGHALLSRAAVQAGEQGVAATTRLLEGSPAAGLVVGVARGAAMLVVGSHGRGRIGRALLGSVSRGCVEHATCPVVVVPAQSSTNDDDPASES